VKASVAARNAAEHPVIRAADQNPEKGPPAICFKNLTLHSNYQIL
jgi:hypothetical protein